MALSKFMESSKFMALSKRRDKAAPSRRFDGAPRRAG